MKKALIVATVFKFLNFEESDMSILKKMGYEIHTATNMREDVWLQDDGKLDYLDLHKHQIDFARSPFSKKNLEAYKQLEKLLKETHFDVIHCHTPVAASIVRMAAKKYRKTGTKIIYTSHGFHFHKTSGWRNWLIFYPIEYIMAHYTDMIITINKEDYSVIQRFKGIKRRYIPGVGVDVDYISKIEIDKTEVRKEFGIPQNAFVIMSVGELSDRKNHEVIIKAISKLHESNVYYLICGTGNKKEELLTLAKKCNISNQVIFAGQLPHEKILELQYAIDLGALPSLIEGLGLAGIETIASGTPIIASNVHGINDYVINGKTGISCAPHDVEGFKMAIEKMINDKKFYDNCCRNAREKAKEFDIRHVKQLMLKNYEALDL